MIEILTSNNHKVKLVLLQISQSVINSAQDARRKREECEDGEELHLEDERGCNPFLSFLYDFLALRLTLGPVLVDGQLSLLKYLLCTSQRHPSQSDCSRICSSCDLTSYHPDF